MEWLCKRVLCGKTILQQRAVTMDLLRISFSGYRVSMGYWLNIIDWRREYGSDENKWSY